MEEHVCTSGNKYELRLGRGVMRRLSQQGRRLIPDDLADRLSPFIDTDSGEMVISEEAAKEAGFTRGEILTMTEAAENQMDRMLLEALGIDEAGLDDLPEADAQELTEVITEHLAAFQRGQARQGESTPSSPDNKSEGTTRGAKAGSESLSA